MINNFSRGELSDRMGGRVDVPGYYQGCRRMQNCIIVSQGGAEKRPGTYYLGDVYDPDGFGTTARLIPFEVSDEEIYVLELGHKAMRIWDSQTKEIIPDTGNGRSYISTPYSGTAGSDEVSEVQFAVTEGQLFFAHQNHPFQFLKMEKDNSGVVTFSLEPHHTLIIPWSISDTYVKNDVVYYLREYWTAIKTTTGATPAVGSWELQNSRLDQSPTLNNPTGDLDEYTGNNFAVGAFKLYEGSLYESLRAFTAPVEGYSSCYPGKEIQTTKTDIGRTQEFWMYDQVVGEFPVNVFQVILDQMFGGQGKTVVFISSYSFSFWDFSYPNDRKYSISIKYKVNVTYPVSSVDDDPYWQLVTGIPYGSRTTIIKEWQPGVSSGIENEIYYDSSFQTFKCLATPTTIDPGLTPEWARLDGNPFFTKDGDFPASVAFMGRRLFIAGTKSHPQTIYASEIGNYDNFNLGTSDSDSFSFEIAAERSSRIKWMMAKDNLMIGTTSSEWLVTGGGISNITPTNVQALRQSSYGSAYNQANYVADSLLFYQKGGRKLREYMYSNDNKAYLANDLTFYADHITETGVSESAYQQNPDSIYWNIKKNGGLIGLTYDRLNGIAGWHSHRTDGEYESVCVVDGVGSEEEVWAVVSRTIAGVNKRFVEVFAGRDQGFGADLLYSDCGVSFVAGGVFKILEIQNNTSSISIKYAGADGIIDGDSVKLKATDSPMFDYQDYVVANLIQGPEDGTFDLFKDGELYTADPFSLITNGTVSIVSNVITGLDHLDGATVSVLGDLAVFPEKLVGPVAGGIGITLETSCNTVVCGLPYTMELEPEPIEFGPETMSGIKRISSVLLKLFKSLGGEVMASGSTDYQKINYRSTSTVLGKPQPLFTGMKEVPVESVSSRAVGVSIRNSQPVPMTILAIITTLTVER